MENNNQGTNGGGSSISITQALNQIQSWLNAGEYKKVIQGCQEILEMEPGNQRAFALMKKAEEKRHAASQATSNVNSQPEPNPPTMEPENTQPEQTHTDRVEPVEDPLAHLQVANETPAATPAAPAALPTEPVAQPAASSPFSPEDELQAEENEIFRAPDSSYAMPEKRKLFLAMLIPAMLVVIVGGGIIWALSDSDHEDEITSIETADLSYLEANEDRVQVLTTLEAVLDKYEDENGEYPSASKIEDMIEDSEYFDEIPEDARHGDFDKAGKVFGYMYAIYDTAAGDNSAYIVSALFEDSRGFGYAWTRGASTSLYDGYRDADSDDVVFIGSDKVSDDPAASSSTDSSSSGPKVKAD